MNRNSIHRLVNRRPSGAVVVGRAFFARESRGNPLGSFPALSGGGRPYNLRLTETVLEPLLRRWGARDADAGPGPDEVRSDAHRACAESRRAFAEILPAASDLGEPAVLAAMGVTANLQRTVALLAEFILDDRGRAPRAGPAFRMSRFWCGLAEYGDASPYHPARVHPPAHAARTCGGRRDPRHLSNALWCAPADLLRCCDQALAAVRGEIRKAGLYAPGSLALAQVRQGGAPSTGCGDYCRCE
jgi:hypothetical protein